MRDSILRTLVPLVVGTLVGWAAKIGLSLPADAVTAVLTPAITLAYYTGARLIEQVWPQAGRILLSLGLAQGSPSYSR
ncbi:hypothetical protein [Actinomadura harenae]|uniref:Uncharacterized protein n=1 Tax=Actinomadura harenae TaxID=2483351 RepID=A0A3M2MJQ6_9ACTN|nr:hypothetical protein [Actinomadura harenae]RMI47618.1 hypothetical protein EBO15_01570 [Actinomadura harenae]